MAKKIITIARQTGSGGHEIAERLAEKLNIPLHDKNLVEEAVKELEFEDIGDVDEKYLIDHVAKFAKGYHAIFGKGKLYHMMDMDKDADKDTSISVQMFDAQSRIIQKLVENGPCIVVGRCGDYILRDRDDVLRVYICAEKEERVQRMMQRRELSHERAVNAVEFTDAERGKYYKLCTGQKWDEPETYDITLNSTALGIDGVVEVLAALYNA